MALQKLVWGARFEDVTPPAVLKIAGHVGGVAAGAFSPDGRLEGFVFGIGGVLEGRPVHWSHMLAVRPEQRGGGVGVRLKLFQRQALLARQVGVAFWTYDPLVARNAHVNLNRLGVRIDRYVRDFYGSGEDSELSAGIGTDRFVVRWELADDRVERAVAGEGGGEIEGEGRAAPVVNVRDGEPVEVDLGRSLDGEGAEGRATAIRIELPGDIQAVRRSDPARAVAWRASTRAALEQALALGFEVDRLLRAPDGRRTFYLLRREGT